MGFKTNKLNKLLENNINVHDYKEISSIDDLMLYAKENNKFSIRFDSDDLIYNLPFYKIDSFDEQLLRKIYEEAKYLNCSLLCSNGYKYDDKLKFNFVIEILDNNDFILELSSKKIPLREMYEHETTIIKGSLFDNFKSFEYINRNSNNFSNSDIEYLINWIIKNNVVYNYIEGTLYYDKVGILNDELIIWQTN